MQSTKLFPALSLATLFLCMSCGFDKLHNDIIADFYLQNKTGEPIIFTMQYYARETSLLPTEVILSIDNEECVSLFDNLAFSNDYSDEDILLFSLSRNIQEDTYTEIKVKDKDISIRWSANDDTDNSIYMLSNWTLVDSCNTNNTTKYKSFKFVIDKELFDTNNSITTEN